MNIQSSIDKNSIKATNNLNALLCIFKVLNEDIVNITDIHLMKRE